MQLLYLGEYILDSHVADCLRQSGKFDRVDHLLKTTLDYMHVGMNPQPDAILLACDSTDHELEWAKRYALDIPKIFIYCDLCEHKIPEYLKLGKTFSLYEAFRSYDLDLDSLVQLVLKETNHEHK